MYSARPFLAIVRLVLGILAIPHCRLIALSTIAIAATQVTVVVAANATPRQTVYTAKLMTGAVPSAPGDYIFTFRIHDTEEAEGSALLWESPSIAAPVGHDGVFSAELDLLDAAPSQVQALRDADAWWLSISLIPPDRDEEELLDGRQRIPAFPASVLGADESAAMPLCPVDQILKRGPEDWMCAEDDDTLTALAEGACNEGDVPTMTANSAWTCEPLPVEPGDITAVRTSEHSGLLGGQERGEVELAVDFDQVAHDDHDHDDVYRRLLDLLPWDALDYDSPGADGPNVFTELYGPPATVLDGWTLVSINLGTVANPVYEEERTVDLQGEIDSSGLFVIAVDGDLPNAPVHWLGNVDWQNGPDAVQLREPRNTVEKRA